MSAARDLDYRFHRLHDKDKVRIEQRRFCSKEDTEVVWEEVANGYDLDGKQVITMMFHDEVRSSDAIATGGRSRPGRRSGTPWRSSRSSRRTGTPRATPTATASA